MGYDFSSPNIASFSTTMFVSPANNVNFENNEFKTKIASENLDKGKSILRALPKVEKKETRNPRTKKVNNKNCDLVITRNTCVNICLLNYLNLFLKYKLVRLV